jgi:amino acid transporter
MKGGTIMDIMVVLGVFVLLALVIKIATDNVAELSKPFADITSYNLIIAFVLTTLGVIALNFGVLEALELPMENSREWFHIYDLGLTSLFLTGGAQSVHKLAEAWGNRKK